MTNFNVCIEKKFQPYDCSFTDRAGHRVFNQKAVDNAVAISRCSTDWGIPKYSSLLQEQAKSFHAGALQCLQSSPYYQNQLKVNPDEARLMTDTLNSFALSAHSNLTPTYYFSMLGGLITGVTVGGIAAKWAFRIGMRLPPPVALPVAALFFSAGLLVPLCGSLFLGNKIGEQLTRP